MKIKYNLFQCFYFIIFSGFLLVGCATNENAQSFSGQEGVSAILEKIEPPTFPNREFSILDYGAKSGGRYDCLPAINKAIVACNEEGGGSVIVPAGIYLVNGPIHLKNNVNLHLEEDAVIKFGTDPDDYLPVVLTRYEGIELMNYSPLIYAFGKKNIAVTGQGILDGQASDEHWWWWAGSEDDGWEKGMPSMRDSANRSALARMAKNGVPVEDRIFGKGHYLRPTFLEFYRCKNILIKGVTFKNAPFWIVHPTLSENITIDGIKTISYGPNNDGCDPESCTNVLIKNCLFKNGDDCIAIKSGRDQDGRRVDVPSKNIIIKNCIMRDGHGGVVIGSETSGGIENIFVKNCKMSSPHLDHAIRIKSNSVRGGVIKNLHFNDIEVGQITGAVIRMNMHYWDEKGKFPPTLDSVFINNVTSKSSEYAIHIDGLKEHPIKNIFISNCDFKGVKKPNSIKNTVHIKITNSTINGKEIK